MRLSIRFFKFLQQSKIPNFAALGLALVLLSILPAVASPPAAPTFVPNSNCYVSWPPQFTQITAPAGDLYFTTDGSDPTSSGTRTLYTGSFQPSASTSPSKTVVKATAFVSPDYSPVTTAYFQADPNSGLVQKGRDVPYGPALVLWLKADNGTVTSGSNCTQWVDMTGNYNASQTSSSNQPTVSMSAINGLPALSFSGSQFLSLPSISGSSLLRSTVFIVLKPTAVNPGARIIELSDSSATNRWFFSQPNNTDLTFGVDQSSTPHSLTATSAITLNSAQLIGSTQETTGATSLFTNGVNIASGSLASPPSVTRTLNFIGTDSTNTLSFQGQIAEILIYNLDFDTLDSSYRTNIQAYLYARYGLKVDAPVVSPAGGVHPSGGLATITELDPGNTTGWPQIRYTLDGTTPTPTSPLYASPIPITSSCTLKTIVYQDFSPPSSNVVTCNFEVDPASVAVSQNGLSLWLKADYGVTQSSTGGVSSMLDMSGSGHNYNAIQNSYGNQPMFGTSSFNGQPEILFDGKAQFLNLPTISTDFSAGITGFAVVRPLNSSSGNVLSLSNGAANDNIAMSTAGTTPTLTVFTAGSSSSVNGPPLNSGNYQLFGGLQTGSSATGYVRINGTQGSSGSLYDPLTVTRSQNAVGSSYNGASNFFQGSLQELLLYNRLLTNQEIADLEAYLTMKYSLWMPIPDMPMFSLSGQTFLTPTQITLSAPAECTIHPSPPMVSRHRLSHPLFIAFP